MRQSASPDVLVGSHWIYPPLCGGARLGWNHLGLIETIWERSQSVIPGTAPIVLPAVEQGTFEAHLHEMLAGRFLLRI